jgi:hypothetical protein
MKDDYISTLVLTGLPLKVMVPPKDNMPFLDPSNVIRFFSIGL